MRALRAPAARPAAPRRRCRSAPRCCAPAPPSPAKRASWPVVLRMAPRLTVPLPPASAPPDDGCSLADYMTLPVDAYVLLPLPLGATLSRLPAADGAPAAASNLFALTIPRVQLFSLAVRPSIHVMVDVVPPAEPAPCVRIAAADAFVDGEWAQQLGLNARFEIYGATRFTWGEDAITSTTDLRVGVDPPPPFSRIPTRVLTRVGDAVLGAVCAQLQRVFVRALAADYRAWASDAEYRQRRAALCAQAAAGGGGAAAPALAGAGAPERRP